MTIGNFNKLSEVGTWGTRLSHVRRLGGRRNDLKTKKDRRFIDTEQGKSLKSISPCDAAKSGKEVRCDSLSEQGASYRSTKLGCGGDGIRGSTAEGLSLIHRKGGGRSYVDRVGWKKGGGGG